jgi:hypothetical protein
MIETNKRFDGSPHALLIDFEPVARVQAYGLNPTSAHD